MALNKPGFSTCSALFLAISTCPIQAPAEPPAATQPAKEFSIINPTAGHQAKGSVAFEKTAEGVRITATLSGLPEGAHGFHIHEKGDCTAPDGKSAGGHYNPDKVNHGGPEANVRHVGDLGNIVADSAGTALYDRIDKLVTLDGENSIIGKGIIIHAGADDLTSQPTGAAGARIACGVIK